ncbi:MAG TPA: hypothetical protein VMD52_06075 [Patescibacteria group bacterium]|nr:hypothetical protein [Patescibacteria group bacterium]
MQDAFEKLITGVYRRWKAQRAPEGPAHPEDEALACFIEGKLSEQQGQQVMEHLLGCNRCLEIFALQLDLEGIQDVPLPQELLERVKSLVADSAVASVLEVVARLREKALELLATTGDVLVGQELVPAPVLRSRNIRDFKDEVTILKDFKNVRVEAKIENKSGVSFSLTVVVKEKPGLQVIKDLRIALFKGDIELESYHVDSGKVTFEHVACGSYTVSISSLKATLASILLDIKT